MTKEPVIINGQRIGRLRASWLLFKESWRFLRADREMLLIPLLLGVVNLLLIGVVSFTAMGFGVADPIGSSFDSAASYSVVFVLYVIGAFTFAYAQAGIAHLVYTRIMGGNATLVDGLRAGFKHSGSLFIWALMAATVGLLLRMIAERSKVLGKAVAWMLGAGWSVLTYFVVPAIVIGNRSGFGAIQHSGKVFTQTWGETVISNISLGLVFFGVYVLSFISLTGFVFVAASSQAAGVLVLFGLVFVVWILAIALVHSTLSAVIKTILYVYASEHIVPHDFNQELLEHMLARQNPVVPPVAPPQSHTTFA